MTGFGAAILGCAGTRLTAQERQLYAQTRPFGFILFTRNLDTADQIRALTSDMRDAVGHDAPVFIDQEGGRVQRLRPPLARDWLPPLDEVARFGPNAARAMALRYRIIAAELRGLGIDGNCVPTLDVARPDTHAVLRNRCYADNPARVAEIGQAVVQGCLQGGVLPVIKHMPGHGRATMDSHLELPRVEAVPSELDRIDFAAFRGFSQAPLGMTAHLVFSAFDPRPATVSPGMIARIREDLGFAGLLMTDDISMQALSGSVPERGAAALAAGVDLVLHCNGDLSEMAPLMERVGPMTAPAQARATAALQHRSDPGPVDIAGIEAEFEALPPA